MGQNTGYYDKDIEMIQKFLQEHKCNQVCHSLGLDKIVINIPETLESPVHKPTNTFDGMIFTPSPHSTNQTTADLDTPTPVHTHPC